MRCMARCLFSISVCAAIALVARSQLKSSQKPVVAATSTLRNRIPSANPSKYRSIVDASDWQNPYLVVSANGIYALPIRPTTEGAKMALADVVTYLEKLLPGHGLTAL